MATAALVEAVFRELGHLIIDLLTLRDVAYGTYGVNSALRGLSRDHVEDLWPRLAPLLVEPFNVQRSGLLSCTTLCAVATAAGWGMLGCRRFRLPSRSAPWRN